MAVASSILVALLLIGLVAHVKTRMPLFLKAIGVAQLALAIGISVYVAAVPMPADEAMFYYFLVGILWALSYMERSKWRNVGPRA